MAGVPGVRRGRIPPEYQPALADVRGPHPLILRRQPRVLMHPELSLPDLRQLPDQLVRLVPRDPPQVVAAALELIPHQPPERLPGRTARPGTASMIRFRRPSCARSGIVTISATFSAIRWCIHPERNGSSSSGRMSTPSAARNVCASLARWYRCCRSSSSAIAADGVAIAACSVTAASSSCNAAIADWTARALLDRREQRD